MALSLTFIILINMAKYSYNKGSVSFCRNAFVEDAFVQSSSTFVEIEQPAGSVITKVYVRFDDAPATAAASTLGFKLGTAEDGSQIIADASANNLKAANATLIANNAIVTIPAASLTAVGQGAPAAAAAYTGDDRTIFATLTASNHDITDAGKVDITVFFDMIA